MEFLLKSASSVLYFVEIIIGFGILVTVHEFGHFLLAKAAGMRVDEFAVGFGKALFSRRRGETIYSIRAIPLGGYNRIYGMEIDEESADERNLTAEEKRRAFNLQPPYKRVAVIVAGSLMNLIFAVILIFFLRLVWGVPMQRVATVNPTGPAYSAGIHEGDVIWSIQGERVGGMDIQRLVQNASATHGGIKLTVLRQGELVPFTLNPMGLRDIDIRYSNLGFNYYQNGLIESIGEMTAADKLGLLPRDYIPTDNGKLVERYVKVDGSYYLAFDVTRLGNKLTLAIPREEVRRSTLTYSGLGFVYDSDWKIISVQKRSPITLTSTQATLKDIKPGDVIVSVDGTPIEEVVDGERVVNFVFGRDDPFVEAARNGSFNVTFKREDKFSSKKFHPGEERRLLGITMGPRVHNVVHEIDEEGPAYEAGLRVGDEIIAVGNEPTWDGNSVIEKVSYSYSVFQGDKPFRILYDPDGLANVSREEWEVGPFEEIIPAEILKSPEEGIPLVGEFNEPLYNNPHFMNIYSKVTLKVRRGNETLDVVLNLAHDEVTDVSRHMGFYFALDPRRVGFLEAVESGFVETAYWISNIFYVIKLLFTGDVQVKELSGPVGIFHISYYFAESGIQSLLSLLVFISVNLAIINLLPFPALDGGRMVFLILELIVRRPVVSIKVENIIHIAGFLLLLIFIIYITFFDIGRLITGFA